MQSVYIIGLVCLLAVLNSADPVPGGWSEITDLNDAGFVGAKDFALAELTKTNQLTLVQVVSGKQAVVEGIKYEIVLKMKDANSKEESCTVTVWEHLRKNTGPENQTLKYTKLSSVCDSDMQIAGGFSDADLNDADFILAKNFALEKLKSENQLTKLVKLVSAKQQVVAGTNYEIVMKMASDDANSAEKTCTVMVWRKLNLTKDNNAAPEHELTSSNCV